MKKNLAVVIGFITLPLLSFCQTADKVANDAFVITRMVKKYHVEPREVDDRFSKDVFRVMLQKTDPGRIFFWSADISRLNAYKGKIGDEIKRRQTAYLNLFVNIYGQRLKQADSLVNEISKSRFDFYKNERFTIAEDTAYPSSVSAMRLKLYKKIKAGALEELADNLPGNFRSLSIARQKKYADSAAAASQKKVTGSVKRKISRVLQNPHGIVQYTGNIYCGAIASCFDPHTEFFPPEEKESFENALGRQPFLFGFRMKPATDGGIVIDNLQPGSPAFKSGKLNKGDKFISFQWDGSKAVDVSDLSIDDFDELLDESSHKKATFTVKKSDGLLVQVSLEKELAPNDNDSRVKSYILNGGNTVGYIYLPAFYEDWDFNDKGLNGCANDVGREILKLKKQNITGLIIDLRYNGGGSVEEAAALAGIFIDAGPVAQEKSRDEKPATINDTDRGTIYDGPLVILVNGYSASAAEMVAGTLQDYNRAVIIGSPTYGKATMQIVLPMDTTVTPENLMTKHTEDYLKLTISKLYRVTGGSAQFKGVQPDIVLPDVLDAFITKEADEAFALKPSAINANKYYQPFPPLPVKSLAGAVRAEIDTGAYFTAVKSFIAYSKIRKEAKDIPLDLPGALAGAPPAGMDAESIAAPGAASKKFIVQNNPYDPADLQDADIAALNEEFRRQIAGDAYISVAYAVIARLKNN